MDTGGVGGWVEGGDDRGTPDGEDCETGGEAGDVPDGGVCCNAEGVGVFKTMGFPARDAGTCVPYHNAPPIPAKPIPPNAPHCNIERQARDVPIWIGLGFRGMVNTFLRID